MRFRTFDDLAGLLREHLANSHYDVVVHCAAVGDYECTGVYAPRPGTAFEPSTGTWTNDRSEPPALVDRRAGKVKSNEPELWLRLVQTPKLIDQMRQPWGFRGVLVKFKLEGGNGRRSAPLEAAEASRLHSRADLMVANTLEGMGSWAFLGPFDGAYRRVPAKQACPAACRGSRASRYVSAELVAAAVCDPPNPFRMVKTASSSTARLS